jgi:hypothetical protein
MYLPQIGKARIFVFYVEKVARRFPNTKAKLGARTAATVERNRRRQEDGAGVRRTAQ